MSKVKIVVNGYPESYKDGFIDHCRNCLHDMDVSISSIKISSVDPSKDAAETLGWDGAKDEKGRKFLSDLKDMSTELYDGPMKYMEEETENWDRDVTFYLIREPAEIKKFVEKFPETITVFIDREESRLKAQSNHADSEVEDYNYKIYLSNNGTIEEIEKKAELFANCIQDWLREE